MATYNPLIRLNQKFATPSRVVAFLQTFFSSIIPITVPEGGTGETSLTLHGILVGQGDQSIAATAAGGTNTVLHGNTGADPTFSTVTADDLAGSIPANKLVETDIVIAESQVTGLTIALGLKAPFASPTFTGVPAAPTATPGTSTTQLATTAFAGAAATAAAEAAVAGIAPITQTTTLTGTQNDFALTAGCTTFFCNNATLLTLTGLAAGVAGQRLTIVSIGAGMVDLSHQDTDSTTAVNRLVNLATVGDTPLAPGKGHAVYVYDTNISRWRLEDHDQGAELTQPYSAGDFTADVGTWTVEAGDLQYLRYYLRGKRLTVSAIIITSAYTNTPAVFLIAIPHGFNAAALTYTVQEEANLAYVQNVTAFGNGVMFVPPSGTTVNLLKDALGTSFGAFNTQFAVYPLITFEVL